MSTGGSPTPAYNVPDILQNAGFEWMSGDALTADTTLTEADFRWENMDPSGGTFTVTMRNNVVSQAETSDGKNGLCGGFYDKWYAYQTANKR